MTDNRCYSPDQRALKIRFSSVCRLLFAAFLMTTTLAGLTTRLAAQAEESASSPVRILATRYPESGDPVCMGDSIVFRVVADPFNGDVAYLQAWAMNKGVGSFSFDGLVFIFSSAYQQLNIPAATGISVFHALGPGSTKILFDKAYPDFNPDTASYASVPVDVQVNDCNRAPGAKGGPGTAPPPKNQKVPGIPDAKRLGSRYTVSSRSTWSVGMEILAAIDSATIESRDGKSFVGIANVAWNTSVIGSPGCEAAEYRITPSRAVILGVVDKENQLDLTILFGPKEFSGFAVCGPGAVSTSNVGTPAPVHVVVPLGGGTAVEQQAATAKNGTFIGSATVVVKPRK
jgi:hypothetical protein